MTLSARVLLAGWVVAVCAVMAHGQAFYLTGAAPGMTSSRVNALSADGLYATGYSAGSPTAAPAFRWSVGAGREDFGLESGIPTASIASAISETGSTVVGHAFTVLPQTNPRAFRWSGPGSYQNLGTFSSYTKTYAQGVSGDGSVVVGRGESGTGGFIGQAFRWTSTTGMVGLGFTRPEHTFSMATAVSRDGLSIVGFSGRTNSDAFMWTSQGGMQALPVLPGTNDSGSASAVNNDGSVIVGSSGLTPTAVMWSNGQIQSLGVAPGFLYSNALDLSDDGSVVVGVLTGETSVAAVWTATRGMEPLSNYLAFHGVPVPEGLVLRSASSVSSDGLVISGWTEGTQSQGFIAIIPSPGTFALLLFAAGTGMTRRHRQASIAGVHRQG